jgi:hypothetical protein
VFTSATLVYYFSPKLSVPRKGVGKQRGTGHKKALQLQDFSRIDFLPPPARNPVMWATVEEVRTLILAQNAEFLKMLAGIREVLGAEASTNLPRAA